MAKIKLYDGETVNTRGAEVVICMTGVGMAVRAAGHERLREQWPDPRDRFRAAYSTVRRSRGLTLARVTDRLEIRARLAQRAPEIPPRVRFAMSRVR